MARIRTIKPDLWADEKVGTWSRETRLLFLASFNMADDEGLLRWTPEYLKSEAFKYDTDIGIGEVRSMMDELQDSGVVLTYHGGSDAQRLGWIVNFHKHQRINRPQPSKFRAPSLQKADVALAYAVRDQWVCHLCHGPVNQRRFVLLDPFDPKGPADISSLNPSLDHKTPRSLGGSDHPSNMALAHVGCNKGRGPRPVESFQPPVSVVRALEHVLTSQNADSLIVHDPFSELSPPPSHNTFTEHSPLEVEREEEGKRKGKGEQPSSATPKQTAVSPSLFDEFWKAYPRRVGKQAAVKAWRRAVNQAPPLDIVDAAVAMAADPNLPDAEFIPHPSKWLNDGRWSDGPYPERTQGRASPPRQSTAEQRAATGWNLVQQLRAEEETEYLNHVLEIGPAS